jgi:hypothetical protein
MTLDGSEASTLETAAPEGAADEAVAAVREVLQASQQGPTGAWPQNVPDEPRLGTSSADIPGVHPREEEKRS